MGTLASCQSDDEAAVSFARPANAVGINVSVGSLKGTTRSNPASADPDEARYFNQGDQISVSTDGQDPVLFQCQNADMQTWAEAEAGKFLLWTQNEMVFKAYYPATDGTSMTAFTLPADQSSEAKIALADYMTRQQTFTNESGTDINLNLERKTARVIVRINSFTDQYDNDEKTVSNVRINSLYSTINDGNGNGDITAVTPYMQGTGGQGTSYTALVVPGYDDDGATFITLTDALNNTLTVKGIPELEAGNSYTYNLTVGKNTIQVQSVTVQDWTTGETLAGGQAESVPVTLVTAITLNKTETLLGVGNTETLSVSSVTPDNATDQSVTWSSDNTDVATVNATTGEVTAVAKGTANITATANDGSGVTATCAVTVTALAGVFVNGATLTMNNFKWSNSKGQALTITYNGTEFSATPSGSRASNMTKNTVTVNGKKITVQCGNGAAFITWVFDTATDHYTYTPSNDRGEFSDAGSFLLNGTDITSQLTKD